MKNLIFGQEGWALYEEGNTKKAGLKARPLQVKIQP